MPLKDPEVKKEYFQNYYLKNKEKLKLKYKCPHNKQKSNCTHQKMPRSLSIRYNHKGAFFR